MYNTGREIAFSKTPLPRLCVGCCSGRLLLWAESFSNAGRPQQKSAERGCLWQIRILDFQWKWLHGCTSPDPKERFFRVTCNSLLWSIDFPMIVIVTEQFLQKKKQLLRLLFRKWSETIAMLDQWASKKTSQLQIRRSSR